MIPKRNMTMKTEHIREKNNKRQDHDSQPEPAASEFEVSCDDGYGNVVSRINWPHRSGTILAAAGVVLCMSLSSCLFPYDGTVGGGATYSIYQPGHRIQSLPAGYRSEMISGATYYYDNGNYYQRDSRDYVVVDAPRNSRYYDDYRRVRENREVNSRRNQRIYDRNNSPNRYGDVIPRLPHGYRVVNHRGQRYYQAGDQYYVRGQGGYLRVRNPY